jgi:hypothetical protein
VNSIHHHDLLRGNFFLQFFQVFRTADFFPSNKPNASAGKRVGSFYIFAMLFKDHKTVAVFKC